VYQFGAELPSRTIGLAGPRQLRYQRGPLGRRHPGKPRAAMTPDPSPALGPATTRRRAASAVILALIAVGLAVPFLVRGNSEWDSVFLPAARHLLAGGDVFRREEGYLYPPFMAFWAIPFTALPPLGSRLAFYLLNITCFAVMVRSAWTLAGGRRFPSLAERPTREHLVAALGLCCGLPFALDALAHQQTDLVIGCCVLAGCLALSRGRDLTAATGFGLAAACKCTALLWAPYLLWRGRWRAALWVGVVAVGVNLLPNLVSSPAGGGLWLGEWFTRYIRPLAEPESYPGTWGSDIIYNQSVAGAGQRWLVTDWQRTPAGVRITTRADAVTPGQLKAVVRGVEVVLTLATLAVFVRRKRRAAATPEAGPAPEVLEYGVVLALMLLFSPMSSKPHFCTLILPGFCLARLAVTHSHRAASWAVGLAAAAALLSNKNLLGANLYTILLWHGCVTWDATALFAGCLVAHWQARRPALAAALPCPPAARAA
jgi:hypothetical protein